MSVTRFPAVMRYVYRSAVFRLNINRQALCLTFDDGPHPGSTTEILNILEKYSVKALFFCTGKNAELYPGIMENIRNRGHITGNHSFSHPDGFFTSTEEYLKDVEKAAGFTSSSLFRPPYGRMRWRQYVNLKRKYTIMLWDLMARDYDSRSAGEDITEKMLRKIRPGSVIIFHDKPECLAKNCLESFIKEAFRLGYTFVLP